MIHEINPANFKNITRKAVKEFEEFTNQNAPRIIVKQAEDLYRSNFRVGGFQNGGVEKWEETKRQQSKTDRASSKYTPLLSRRVELMKSIAGSARQHGVEIASDKPYADIHNRGGRITSSSAITPRMRRWFWAMHFKQAGRSKKKRREHSMWMGLALTKKEKITRTVNIPQRKFVGDSKDLAKLVKAVFDRKANQLNQ